MSERIGDQALASYIFLIMVELGWTMRIPFWSGVWYFFPPQPGVEASAIPPGLFVKRSQPLPEHAVKALAASTATPPALPAPSGCQINRELFVERVRSASRSIDLVSNELLRLRTRKFALEKLVEFAWSDVAKLMLLVSDDEPATAAKLPAQTAAIVRA